MCPNVKYPTLKVTIWLTGKQIKNADYTTRAHSRYSVLHVSTRTEIPTASLPEGFEEKPNQNCKVQIPINLCLFKSTTLNSAQAVVSLLVKKKKKKNSKNLSLHHFKSLTASLCPTS